MPALVPIRYGSSPEGTPKRPLVLGRASAPTPPVDPYFEFVILLWPADGPNGSTTGVGFVDYSPVHNPDPGAGGTSHIDTSQFVFGGSSYRISGLFPATIFLDNEVFRLSTANSDQFTIEFWGRLTEVSATESHAALQTSFPSLCWNFGVIPGGEVQFNFGPFGGGPDVSVTSSGANVQIDTFYNFTCDKDAAGKIRIYMGTTSGGHASMIASATPADSAFIDFSNQFKFAPANPGSGRAWPGWIDEIRITRGIARYASDSGFTLDDEAFPLMGPP